MVMIIIACLTSTQSSFEYHARVYLSILTQFVVVDVYSMNWLKKIESNRERERDREKRKQAEKPCRDQRQFSVQHEEKVI